MLQRVSPEQTESSLSECYLCFLSQHFKRRERHIQLGGHTLSVETRGTELNTRLPSSLQAADSQLEIDLSLAVVGQHFAQPMA